VKRLLFALALAVPLGGCGSGDDAELSGAPLDCAWLASENCWKTLVASAASCVPPPDEKGTLNGDGTACTYQSGAAVDFRIPIALPVPTTTSPPWNFTQSSNGDECVRFDSTSESEFTLSVQGKTYREKSSGFGLQVTCPDGTQYATDDGLDLVRCSDYLSNTPGHNWTSTDTDVSFGLLNGHGMTLPVFDCGN
jgi:hypothetical protein